MKKLSLVVLLGLMLGAVLTGCNKPAGEDATPPPATNDVVAPTNAP